MSERKGDHLNLANDAQVSVNQKISNFNYEPLFNGLAFVDSTKIGLTFLNKELKAPLWISSMTGGTSKAGHINKNLAQACNEFGFGMGLGSCRALLENEKHFNDFNLRPIIGDDLPFYANFGIAQIESAIKENKIDEYFSLVETLKCDGLIVHINPLQEWFQDEGDRYIHPPIETLSELLSLTKIPVIVKEVGQGFGPESLKALMKMPLAAIEFGAFGGTNFTLLEMMRSQKENGLELRPFAQVGHSASEMVEFVNSILKLEKENVNCRSFIISGGIKSFLEGHSLISSLKADAVYGQARNFLEHAVEDYEKLQKYCQLQIQGLKLAKQFLNVVE